MNVIGVILIAVALGAMELPALVRRRQWRDVFGVVTVLLLGAVYGVAVVVHAPIPSVAQLLMWMAGMR